MTLETLAALMQAGPPMTWHSFVWTMGAFFLIGLRLHHVTAGNSIDLTDRTSILTLIGQL